MSSNAIHPARSARLAPVRCPWSALLALAFLACGGKADDPDIVLGGEVGGAGEPFLAECRDRECGGGFECLEGVCTQPCTTNADCGNLSESVECVDGPAIGTRDTGICAVPCTSDDACFALGAGSFCNNAFCTAGNLDVLPASFDVLNLSYLGPELAAPECFAVGYTTRFQLLLRTNSLTWSRCEQPPSGDGYQMSASRRELDGAESAALLDAYRRLRLSSEPQCTADAAVFTLDLEPQDGGDLLFADGEHSACPVVPLRSSFVSGISGFYSFLESMNGAFR